MVDKAITVQVRVERVSARTVHRQPFDAASRDGWEVGVAPHGGGYPYVLYLPFGTVVRFRMADGTVIASPAAPGLWEEFERFRRAVAAAVRGGFGVEPGEETVWMTVSYDPDSLAPVEFAIRKSLVTDADRKKLRDAIRKDGGGETVVLDAAIKDCRVMTLTPVEVDYRPNAGRVFVVTVDRGHFQSVHSTRVLAQLAAEEYCRTHVGHSIRDGGVSVDEAELDPTAGGSVQAGVAAELAKPRPDNGLRRCHDCGGWTKQPELYQFAADANGVLFPLRCRQVCVRCAAAYDPEFAASQVRIGVVAPTPDWDAVSRMNREPS